VSKHKPIAWLSRLLKAIVILQWLIAWLPLGFTLALFGLSTRASQLIGKVPLPFQDDPAHIGASDGIYKMLYRLADVLCTGVVYSVLIWLTGTIALTVLGIWHWKRNQAKGWVRWGWGAIVVYLIGLLILCLEPTNRLGWWFD
jgi:hypothetical protein